MKKHKPFKDYYSEDESVFSGPGEEEAYNRGKAMRKHIKQQPGAGVSAPIINNPGPNYTSVSTAKQTRTYKNKNIQRQVFKTDV